MSKKSLYLMFHLNKPFRLLILDKLENGLKGYEFKDENKEIDKVHIDILKNWKTKDKETRMSFINSLNLSEIDEGLALVNEKKEQFKDDVKESVGRKKTTLKNMFKTK